MNGGMLGFSTNTATAAAKFSAGSWQQHNYPPLNKKPKIGNFAYLYISPVEI